MFQSGEKMRLTNIAKRLGTSERVACAFLILASAVAASALWLGTAAATRYAEAAKNESAAERDLAVVANLSKEDAEPKDAGGVLATLGGVGDFQSFVEEQASRRDCSVAEFQVSPDSQPFVPHFEKDRISGSWTQVQVMFAVEGRLPDVYDAVSAVSQQSVAFEPTSVEFERKSLTETGAATVLARVQGHIVQGAGGAK
jgi:hypothetical protein